MICFRTPGPRGRLILLIAIFAMGLAGAAPTAAAADRIVLGELFSATW